MNLRKWLNAIGLVCFGFILYGVDWFGAYNFLREVKGEYFLIYGLIFLLSVFFKIFRFQWICQKIGSTLTFVESTDIVMKSTFYGIVTPGRVGDFSRAYYLVDHGIKMKRGVFLMLLEKGIDATIFLFIAIGGAVYISDPLRHGKNSFFIIAFLILFFFTIILLGVTFKTNIPETIAKRYLDLDLGDFKKTAILIYVTGLISTIFFMLQIIFLSLSFNFNVDYFLIIFTSIVSSFVALLPISIAGIGTREATYILMMGSMGISKEGALIFSLIDGLVAPLTIVLSMIFLLMLYKKWIFR
jgi:uncharacterized membrane protein YbhN (UPF0104 family)